MPTFMLTYVGNPSHPATPEEGKQHMAKYQAWLSSLGSAAISPMNPLKNTCLVKPDASVSEGGSSGMSGFTLIEADTLDRALDIAKNCPYLGIGGSLEVSEIINMGAKA